jgi:multidrug transporter EmrE-like cation transporter
MGILLAFIAGLFVPLTNLCVRKSVDVSGNAKAFFVFQMLSSLLLTTCLGPLRQGLFQIPLSVALLGTLAGLFLSGLLFFLGKAVEKGPPALTFAILNSATVMPGLLMALVFGASLGFIYNFWHALGSFLVLSGLFWGAKGLKGMKEIRSWLFFSASMFFFHVLLLSLYQYRAMLMNLPNPEELVSFFTSERIKSVWFVPFMFLSSGLVQLGIYLNSKQIPHPKEAFFGTLGGLFNFLCTFFLIWATEVASPLENAVIFPIYSVIGIILTNVWGAKLYKEEVNWRACLVCLLGLIIGTIDWKAL